MVGPTYQEKRQIFARQPLLGKFSESEIDTLLKYSRVECYPAGEEIYAKDSPANCMMLVLNRRDFLPVLRDHADLCMILLKVLCRRLRQTSEQVEDLVFRDVEQRIAKSLLQLCHRFGRAAEVGCPRELHLSQSELANIIGITRESVNKQLKIWQRAGFVDLAKESIIIRNAPALEQLI